jgi:hypothetical protein
MGRENEIDDDNELKKRNKFHIISIDTNSNSNEDSVHSPHSFQQPDNEGENLSKNEQFNKHSLNQHQFQESSLKNIPQLSINPSGSANKMPSHNSFKYFPHQNNKTKQNISLKNQINQILFTKNNKKMQN